MSEGQPSQENKNLAFYLERDEGIKKRRKTLLTNASKEEIKSIFKEEFEYVETLKKNYPNDYKNRATFQAFLDSTIRGVASDINEEDFPGEDSVEEFLKRQEKRYLKKA